MKRIIVSALAIIFTFSGCSGFLDEELKKNMAPSNTYTSSYGFEVGVTGLYGIARSEYNTWGGSFATQSQACPYEVLQIATDIVVGGHEDGSKSPFETLSYTSSTTFVTSFWNYAYGLIASANEILTYSEKDVNWDTPEDKVKYQAEARFFRAYGYRYLIYLYGDVPYVDKIEENFRLDYTRTPKEEVLGYMIDDLKFASENLPQNPDNLVPGRLNKWAAEHYLSEIYLLAGKYEEAEASARRVINSGYFSLTKERYGVALDKAGDYYSDMFEEYNPRRTNGNRENIWILTLEYNTTGGGGEYEDWTKRAWVPKYYNEDGFVLTEDYGGRGLAQIVPMKWWIDGSGFYDADDIRNSEYNIKRQWIYNDESNAALYGKQAEITDETWFVTNTVFPAITKFFFGKDANPSYGGNNKDRIKARLAETYLFLAEACLRQNKLTDAAEAINEVRSRANATPITSASVNDDFLLDERIREMVGEELRRFTLVRFGKLVERSRKYNTVTNTENRQIQDYHSLWPIPQTVIDSNTGAEFPQNPGYN